MTGSRKLMVSLACASATVILGCAMKAAAATPIALFAGETAQTPNGVDVGMVVNGVITVGTTGDNAEYSCEAAAVSVSVAATAVTECYLLGADNIQYGAGASPVWRPGLAAWAFTVPSSLPVQSYQLCMQAGVFTRLGTTSFTTTACFNAAVQ